MERAEEEKEKIVSKKETSKYMKRKHRIISETNKGKSDKVTERNKRKDQEVKIQLINVNGLTRDKFVDLMEMSFRGERNYNVLCMVETHLRHEKFPIDVNNLHNFNAMREEGDKKGGGLKILMEKTKKVEVVKKESKSSEILEIEGTLFDNKMKIILVYFDVNKDKDAIKKNDEIRKEIENKMKKSTGKALMILGDFNAHTKILEPDKKENANGQIVNKWIDELDLMILNADEKCSGKWTRTRNNQQSAIDLVLVNRKMYELCKKMEIDERKELISFSDHNLIEITLNIGSRRSKSFGKKCIEEEYYTKDKDKIKEVGNELDKMWKDRQEGNINTMLTDMKEIVDRIAKKSIKRRIGGRDETEIECEWTSDEIRNVIKDVRKIRKLERKEKDEEKLDKLAKERDELKRLKHRLIIEAKTKHEMKIKEEIENSDNKMKKMWEYMNKMRQKRTIEKGDEIYEEGQKMEDKVAINRFFDQWRGIYQKDPNEIDKVWNEEIKMETEESYRRELKEREMETRNEINEIIPMKANKMNSQDLVKRIKKLKNNKAPGPDGSRGEYFKELIKNEECIRYMVKCFNSVLEEDINPEGWSKSKTKMIKKTRKPTVKDFRPITLTCLSYKIYMSFIREQIGVHLKKNRLVRDNQIGFTEGGRIEYNHLILQYIVDESMQKKNSKAVKEGLVVVALDFRKAYDSVNRKSLIETLRKYKIDAKIINLIAKIYTNDTTSINMMGEERNIEISSGIRQGCTVSTELFKLVTYEIIKKLEEEGEEFCVEGINLSSLFFADDNILAAASIKQVVDNLKIVKEISREFGLVINEEKSKALVYKWKEEEKETEEIEGIRIVKRMKYLGLEICDERDIFKYQKENMIAELRKLANATYYAIETSYNRVLIGKLWWKSLALSKALFGLGTMTMKAEQIRKMQVIENKVFRLILRASSNTPVAALRGEIGATSMKSRARESRLLLAKSILDGDNELMKMVLWKSIENKGNRWGKRLRNDLKEVRMSVKDLQEMNKTGIRKRVREIDKEEWQMELEKLSSLKIYRENKNKIEDEGIYENSEGSMYLCKARTNSLELNSRTHFLRNGNRICDLCEEEETLEHFLLDCEKLETKRNYKLLSRYRKESKEETIGSLLFKIKKEDLVPLKEMLSQMWKKRDQLVREKEKFPTSMTVEVKTVRGS